MDNKLDTITNLFEGKEIRSIWDAEKEEYHRVIARPASQRWSWQSVSPAARQKRTDCHVAALLAMTVCFPSSTLYEAC